MILKTRAINFSQRRDSNSKVNDPHPSRRNQANPLSLNTLQLSRHCSRLCEEILGKLMIPIYRQVVGGYPPGLGLGTRRSFVYLGGHGADEILNRQGHEGSRRLFAQIVPSCALVAMPGARFPPATRRDRIDQRPSPRHYRSFVYLGALGG